jgi:hypothetical protein
VHAESKQRHRNRPLQIEAAERLKYLHQRFSAVQDACPEKGSEQAHGEEEHFPALTGSKLNVRRAEHETLERLRRPAVGVAPQELPNIDAIAEDVSVVTLKLVGIQVMNQGRIGGDPLGQMATDADKLDVHESAFWRCGRYVARGKGFAAPPVGGKPETYRPPGPIGRHRGAGPSSPWS